jgi:hypothetical protein
MYIWNNSVCINYRHFANTKGTIYGNRLSRGTQVKKDWVTLRYMHWWRGQRFFFIFVVGYITAPPRFVQYSISLFPNSEPHQAKLQALFGHTDSSTFSEPPVTLNVMSFITPLVSSSVSNYSWPLPWLRWSIAGLTPRSPAFGSRSVHVGVVVDKVAL